MKVYILYVIDVSIGTIVINILIAVTDSYPFPIYSVLYRYTILDVGPCSYRYFSIIIVSSTHTL